MQNFSLKMNWVSIVMLLSLGVNFFVIGFLYAQHKAREIRMTRLSFDHSISKLMEPLPRSGKHEIYLAMRSKRDELIPIYKNIMAKRAEIMTIIAEDPFDGEKLQKAMQDYNGIYQKMVSPTHDVIIKVIGNLDAAERKAILERYNNPPRRDFRSRSSNDNRMPSPPDQNDQRRDW
ncbi:MAG: periplasmic heavy metal sensor [Alphaproteobacteria bacterium]|nr:periplasmic heavy metal sensor [Alphaproteobacteria bacterium]HPF45852.1 periplasmic heavy metal sensor [Emcibacteraceae bacterium]